MQAPPTASATGFVRAIRAAAAPPADASLKDALLRPSQEAFDVSKLPEMLSAPGFGSPAPLFSGAIDGAKAALQSLSGVGPQLAEAFGST